MTKPNIKQMFHTLNAQHFGGVIKDIPVVWNTRMTTTAGMCRYRRLLGDCIPTKIELSDKLFRHLDFDFSKVERTLIHEMVHAYLLQEFNERGHTARFQNMMTEITGEYKNHRCHSYDTTGIKRKQKKNVKAVCQKCGFTYHKARMPKHAAYANYTHRGCGGVVKFSWVEDEDIRIF